MKLVLMTPFCRPDVDGLKILSDDLKGDVDEIVLEWALTMKIMADDVLNTLAVARKRGLKLSIENDNEFVFKDADEADEVALSAHGVVKHPCYPECFDNENTCDDGPLEK